MPDYVEVMTKTPVHKITSERLPYRLDLNPYRGCEHRCRYCFALYSHTYLGSANFFSDIHVKVNIAERLEQHLKNTRHPGVAINLGGVTDSYQPAEEAYKLMPEIWRVLIRYRTPAIISTKSDLILRDFDLICQLAALTYVNVACTITTLDEGLAALLEPGAAAPARRLSVLKTFASAGVHTGLHAMPVIPLLTDGRDNLTQLMSAVCENHIDYLIADPLNLRGQTKLTFLEFIKSHFPKKYSDLAALYQSGHLSRDYKQILLRRVAELRREYGVSANYKKHLPAQRGFEQLSLF